MNRRNRGKSQPQRGKKSFKANVKSSKFTPKRKSKLRLNKADAKETPSTESLGRLQATAAATTTTTTATAVTTTTTSSITSKETVNQHVMTARLLEKDVGITEYISKHEGFSGIIKQRFSDFHVNEIDIDGNVVILTSTSVPELPVDVDEAKKAEDYLKDAVPKESLEKLKQLLESKGDDNVEIEVSDMSKEDRRKMHMAILKYGLRRLNSNTKERDGKKYITVSAKPDRRVSWPSERGGEYVQFVLHKENMDTMETVNVIAGKLRVKPNLIGYAGTKDRRAKTSQLMSVRRVEPSKLANSARNLRGVTLGNYTFKESGLKLGQLCGNRFRIVLRNVTGKDIQIKEAMTSLEEKGFINYFGLQRFGNSLVIPTYEIGKAILQTKWKEAVELILKPRDGEQLRDLSEARKVWWETRDAARALKLLRNPNKHIEGKLLEALSNLGPNNYCDALNKLPNNALSLYMHAYQSLLWNKVVSRRISEFGLHALAGDLVPKEGSAKAGGDDPAVEDDALNVTGSSEETSFSKKDDVRVIGEKELANTKIEDIVVPLPGYDITYPDNVTGEWMQELLKKDGLESMSFRKTLKHFKVGGTYRRLVIRPTNVNWKVMRYSDPQAALLLSDLEMMQNVPAPRNDPDGAYKALVLEFHLPSSCYATMALREILKTDTSVSLQASLNDYHIPKPASKSKENGAEGVGESETDALENGSISQEGPSKMKTRRNSSQKSEISSIKGKGKVTSEGDKTRQEESRANVEEYTSPKKIKSSESTTNKAETSVKTKGKRTAEHFDATVVKPKEALKKPKTVESISQKLEDTLTMKTRAKRSSDHLDHSASETEDSKEEKIEVDDVSNKKVRCENDPVPAKTRGRTTPKHVESTADSEEASSEAEEPLSGKKTRSKSKLRYISEGETVEHEDNSKTRSRAKTKLRENIEDVRTEAEDNTVRTRSKGREVSDGNKIPEETKTEHEDSVPNNPSVRTRSKFREAPVEETKLEGEEVIPYNASLRTRSKAREIPEGGKINDEMKLESEDTSRENPSVRTRSKVREVSDGNKTAEEVKIESDECAPENLPVRTRSKVREASEGTKSNDETKLDSEENAPVRTRSKALSKSRDSTSESEGTKDDDLLKNKSERCATPSRAELSEDKPSVRTRSRAISKLVDSPALESEGGTEDEDTSSVASSPSKAKLPVRTRSKAKYRDSSLSDNDSAKVEPPNSAEEGSSSVRTRSRVQSKLRDSPALDTDGSRDSIEGPDTNIGPVRTRSRISSRSRDSPAPEKLAEDSKQDILESVEERPTVKTRTRSSSKAFEAISLHSGDNRDEKLQAKKDDQKAERNPAVNENIKKERAELERDNKRIKLDENVKKSGKILQLEKSKVEEERERNENVRDQAKKLPADNNRASDKMLGSKETEEGNGSNKPPSLELPGDISVNSEKIGVKVKDNNKVSCDNEMKEDASLCEDNTSKGAVEGLSSLELDSSLGETCKKLEENKECEELKRDVTSSSVNHKTDVTSITKIPEGVPTFKVSEDSTLESPAQNIKQNLTSGTNLLSDVSNDSSALDRLGLANKPEIEKDKDETEIEISANQNVEKLTNAEVHSETVEGHKFEPQTQDAVLKLGDSNTEIIVPKEVSQVGVTHELNGSLSEKVDSSSNTDCKPDTLKSGVCNSYSDLEIQKNYNKDTDADKDTENACNKINSEVSLAASDVSASLTESVSQNRDSNVLEKTYEEKMHHQDNMDFEVSTKESCVKEIENKENLNIISASVLDAATEVTGETSHLPKVSDGQKELENTNIHEKEMSVQGAGALEQRQAVNSNVKICCETLREYNDQNKPLEKTEHSRKEQIDGNKIDEIGENKFNIRGGIEESAEDQSISESLCHMQSNHGQKTDDSAAEAAVSSPKTDSVASRDDREVANATDDTGIASVRLESKDVSRPIDENSVSESKDTTLASSGSDSVVKNEEVPSAFINTECDILPGNIECSVEKDDSKQKKDDGASVLKHEPLSNKNLKLLAEGEEKTDLLNETDVIGPCETDTVHKTETREEPLETSVAKTKTDLSMETGVSSAEKVGSSACFSEPLKSQDIDISDATILVKNTSKIDVYKQEAMVKDESCTKSSISTETVDSIVSEKSGGCIVDGNELSHKPICNAADGQGDNAKGTVSSSSKPVCLPNEDKSDGNVEAKVAFIHQDKSVTKITKAIDSKSDSTFSPQDLSVSETDMAMEDVHERSEQNVTSECNQQAECKEILKMEEKVDENESLNVGLNSDQHHLKLSLGTETDSNKSEIKLTQMLPVKESLDDQTLGKNEDSQSMRRDDCPSILDVSTLKKNYMEIHDIDAVKDKMGDGYSVGGRYKETHEETHECLQTENTTASHSEVQNEKVGIVCTDAIERSNETVQVGNNGKVCSKDISGREQALEENAPIAVKADNVMDICKKKCPALKNHDAVVCGTLADVSKHKLVAISNLNVSESVQELKKSMDTSSSNEKSMAPAVKAVACNNEKVMAKHDGKTTPKIKLAEERQEICIKVDDDNMSSTKEVIQENISVGAIAEGSAKTDLSELGKVTSFTATESLVEPISPAEPTVPESEPLERSNSKFPSLYHEEAVVGLEKLQGVTSSNRLCESMSPKQETEDDSSVVERTKMDSKGIHSVDLTVEEEKQDMEHDIGFNTSEPTEIVKKSLSLETDVEKDSSGNFELVKSSTSVKSPVASVKGKDVMVEMNKPTDMQTDQPSEETVLVASDTVDDRQINSVSEEPSDISKELRDMGQNTSLLLAAEISMPLQSAEIEGKDKNSDLPTEGKVLHEPEKSSGNADRNGRDGKSQHAIENKDEMLVLVGLDKNDAELQERLKATGDVKEEEISSSVTETPKEISCISEDAQSSSEDIKGCTGESLLSSELEHLQATDQKAVLKSSEVHSGSETETGTIKQSEDFEIEVKGASLKPPGSESQKENSSVSQHLEITSPVTEVAFEDKGLGTNTTKQTTFSTIQSVDLSVEGTLQPSVKLSNSSINDNISDENVKEIKSTGLSENVRKMETVSSEDSGNRTEVTSPRKQTNYSNEMEVDMSSSELHEDAIKSSNNSDATEMTDILKPVPNLNEISQANNKIKPPIEEIEEIGEVPKESRLSLECSAVIEEMDKTTSSEKFMQGTEMDESGKPSSKLTVVSTANSDEGVSVSVPKVAEKEDETVTMSHSPVVADNIDVTLPSETMPIVTETLDECCSKGQLNNSEMSDETSATETTNSNLLGNRIEEDSASTGLKTENLKEEGVLERKEKTSSLEIQSVKEIVPPEHNEVPVVIDDAVRAEAVGMSKTNEETLVHQPSSSEKFEESVTLNSQITFPENGKVSKMIESTTTVESLGESSESVGKAKYSKEQEGVEQVKEMAFSEYVTSGTEPSEQHGIVVETATLSEHTDDVKQNDVSSEQLRDTPVDCVEHGTMEKAIPTKRYEVSRAEEIVLSEQSEESPVGETKLPEVSKLAKKKEAVLFEQSGIQTDDAISSERQEAAQTKNIKVSEQTNVCQMEVDGLSEQGRTLHADDLSSEHPEGTQTEETKLSQETEEAVPQTEETKPSGKTEGVPSEQPIVTRSEENVDTPQMEATMPDDQPELTRVKDAIDSEQIEFAEAKETVFSEHFSNTREKVAAPSEHDISRTKKTKTSDHIEAIQVAKSPEQNYIALSEEPSKQNEVSLVEDTASSHKAIRVQMEEILPLDQYGISSESSEITCIERAVPSKQREVDPVEGVESPEQCEVSSQEKNVSCEKSVTSIEKNVLIDRTLLSERKGNKLENTVSLKHDSVVLEEEDMTSDQCRETGMKGTLSPVQQTLLSCKSHEVRKVAESIPFEQNELPRSEKIESSEKCEINQLEKIMSSDQHVRETASSKQYEVNQVDKAPPTGQIEENRMKESILNEPHEVILEEESLHAEKCKVTHMEEDLTSEKHLAKVPEVMSSQRCYDTRSEGNHSSESTDIKFLPTGKLDQQENPEIDEDSSREQKKKCTSECFETPQADVISEQHSEESLLLCKQGDASSKRSASCELSVKQEGSISSKRRKLSPAEAVKAGVSSQEGEISQMDHELSEQHNGDLEKLVTPSEKQVILKNTKSSELSEVIQKEDASFNEELEVTYPDEISRGVKVGGAVTSQSNIKKDGISSTKKPVIQIGMGVSSESNEISEMEENLSSDQCKVTDSEVISIKHEVHGVDASLLCKQNAVPPVAKSKFHDDMVQRTDSQVDEALCIEQLESSQRGTSPEQPDVTLTVKNNERKVMCVTKERSSFEQSETFLEMEETKPPEQPSSSQISRKQSESTTAYQCLEESISSETESTKQTVILTKKATSEISEAVERIEATFSDEKTKTLNTITDTSSSEPTDVHDEKSLSSEQPVILERIEETSSPDQHKVLERMDEISVEQPLERMEESPVEQPSERMEESPVEQPSERMEESPVEQPSERMEESPVEQPSERMEESPVEQPSERTEESPVEQPSERTEESPVEQPSEGTEESPVEQPSEGTEESPVEQPPEGTEESPVEQPPEGTGESPVEQPSEGTEDSPVEQPKVSEETEESSLEQAEVMQTVENSSSLKQPEILQKTEESSLEQHNDLPRMEDSSSEQLEDLQKMESSTSKQSKSLQKVAELLSSEQAAILQRAEDLESSEQPKVVQKQEESASSEQPEILPMVEESTTSKQTEVLKREEESITSKRLEAFPVLGESASSKQPEILQRIEKSLSSEQPAVLQRAESSISSNQPEVLQRVEESAPLDLPDASQAMKKSSSEQPVVLERLLESSCSNQTEVLQRMEESCSDQPEVLQRMEQSSCSDQPEVLQRMDESSCSDQLGSLQRMDESSCSDKPEVLQRMDESSCSDKPEVLQRMDESSCSDKPEVLQRMDESSCSDKPEVLQRMDESSCSDKPEVLQRVDESSCSDKPEVLQRVDESSCSDKPEVLQRVDESSCSDKPEVLQRVDESSCSDKPEVLQRVDESSCSDKPEVLQRVEESSCSDKPEVLQRLEESSSDNQPEVLQRLEESSSSDNQPEVLQRVEESSSSDNQPEVLQRVEESSSSDNQPEVLQRVEESSSSDNQPEVLQRVEESSSSDQHEILQKMKESLSMEEAEMLQKLEDPSPLNQPEILQRMEELSAPEQREVFRGVEKSSHSEQPEVLHGVEESSSLEQPGILQRMEESPSPEHFKVSKRMEKSSPSEQLEVLGRTEELSSLQQPGVLRKMEGSSVLGQLKVLQRKEETPPSEQLEILQRMEDSSSAEQPEVLQKMKESSLEQPEFSPQIEQSSSVQPVSCDSKPSEQSEVSVTKSSEKAGALVEGSSEQPKILERMESSAESEVLQRDGKSVSSNPDKLFRPLPTSEHPKVRETEEFESSDKSKMCIVLVEPESSPKQSENVLGIENEQKSGIRETFSTSPAVLSQSCKESEDSSLEKPECSILAKNSEPILGCNISSLPTNPSKLSDEGTVGMSVHPKTSGEIEETIALPEKSEVCVTEVELQVSKEIKEGTYVHRELSERNGTIYSNISGINNEAIQSNEMSQKCETSEIIEGVKSYERSESVEKVEFVASSESSKADNETKLSKSSFTSETTDSEHIEAINETEKMILPEKLQGVEKMDDRGLSESKVSKVELNPLFRKQQSDVKVATQSEQLENSDIKPEGSLSEKLAAAAILDKPSQSDQMAVSKRLGDISVLDTEESGKQEASELNEPQLLDGTGICKVAGIPLSDEKKESEVLCKSLEIYVTEEKKQTSIAKENLDGSIPEKVKDLSSPKCNRDFRPVNEKCTTGQSSTLSPKTVEANDNVSATSQEGNFALSNSDTKSVQDVCHNLEGAEQLSADKTQQCSIKELSNEIFCKQEGNLKCNESDTHSPGTVLDASQPSSERSAQSKELVTSETDLLKSSLSEDEGTKELVSISGNSNDTKLELAVKRKADEDDGSSQEDCQINTKKVRLPTEDNEQQSQEVPAKRKADEVDNTSSEENKRVRLGESTVNGGDNEEGSGECVLKRKSLEVNCDSIEVKKAKLEASDAPE